MEATETNNLIAEFMGWKHFFKPKQMEFATSWGWLMPVVEKIDKTPVISNANEIYYYCVSLQGSVVDILDSNTGVNVIHIKTLTTNWKESTYKAVVEFIKFYNQNK